MAAYDPRYEFDAPRYRDLSAMSDEDEPADAWFGECLDLSPLKIMQYYDCIASASSSEYIEYVIPPTVQHW